MKNEERFLRSMVRGGGLSEELTRSLGSGVSRQSSVGLETKTQFD
jgi:hypothetical protein